MHYRIFTRSLMISSHRIPPIAVLYIFILGAFSKYIIWEGRGSRRRKQQKMTQKGGGRVVPMWCPTHKFFYVLYSVTQSLYLFGFSWSSDNTTASNKKGTFKKDPTSVSEITSYIIFAQKYNSNTLSMWAVFTYICV